MQDIKEYTDDLGLIYPGKINGRIADANARLYTAQYYMLRTLLDLDTLLVNRVDFNFIMSRCCLKLGLYNRHPRLFNALEQHDNDIGMLAALTVLGSWVVQGDIYKYGEAHGYIYNNLNKPELNYVCQRLPHHIAFIKYCAGKNPPIWQKLWLVGTIVLTIIKRKYREHKKQYDKETSTTILCKMMLIALRKHKTWSILDDIFNSFIDIGKVTEAYFEPGHPLVDMWKEYYKTNLNSNN